MILCLQFASCADACQSVLAATPGLSDREREFVLNLRQHYRQPSSKQCGVLRRLVMRALAAGAAP